MARGPCRYVVLSTELMCSDDKRHPLLSPDILFDWSWSKPKPPSTSSLMRMSMLVLMVPPSNSDNEFFVSDKPPSSLLWP